MIRKESPDRTTQENRPVWTSPSPWTRYAASLAAAALLMATLIGCSVEPFNPKAEVAITSVEPAVLRPTWTDSRTVLPLAKVNLTSTNTIPMTLQSWQIEYTGPDGRVIEMPALSRSGSISQTVQAMGASESSARVTPFTMEVFTPAVYSYACNGTTSEYSDDITPISAVITLAGKDVNNNVIEMKGAVNLSTSQAAQDAVTLTSGTKSSLSGSLALTLEVTTK